MARCQLCDFAREACPQIYYCKLFDTNKIYNEVCPAFRGVIHRPTKIRRIDGKIVIIRPGDLGYEEA